MKTSSKNELKLKRTAFKWQGLEGSIYRAPASSGPLLVLQHGLTGDYRGLVPLAAELHKNYSIVMVELPGHGRSPIPDKHLSLSDLGEWFAAALATLESNPSVVAHSFGCSIALRALANRSRSMANCILLNPVPHTSASVRMYQWLTSQIPYEVASRIDDIDLVRQIKLYMMLERPEVRAELPDHMMPRLSAFEKARTDLYLDLGKQVLRDDIYESPDLQKRWSRVGSIIGPKDRLLSTEASEVLKKYVGEQNIIAIPRTGHLTPIEAPAETAASIQTLLNNFSGRKL